jgi:hypothetical protein
VNICSLDTNKNANKNGWPCELLRVFSMRRENCPENQKSSKDVVIVDIFSLVPLADTRPLP